MDAKTRAEKIVADLRRRQEDVKMGKEVPDAAQLVEAHINQHELDVLLMVQNAL